MEADRRRSSTWIRITWRFWLGIGISAVFLSLAIRQVDWNRTFATLSRADPLLIVAGLGLLLVTFVLFALRWQILLLSVARVSLRDSFSYIMVGYVANTVLPARLGDVVRAALLGHRRHISATSVFGSIMVERILDVLTLLTLTVALSSIIDVPPVVRGGVMTLAVGALVALLVLSVLAFFADRLPSLTLPASLDRLLGLVERLAQGVRSLQSARQATRATALSGLAWVIAGVGTVFWVTAFHLPVPWYAGMFVLVVVNLGSAIPSSPGFIGVYHYLVVLALSVWIPDKSVALAYAIASHGLNIALNVVIGSVCLWREGLGLAEVSRMSRVSEAQDQG
ncbi:MAG: flippase-like domain-containing protein [Anaerolineae bacterium]|nr:flippase-like domain-containing protein [Anaerolineae bacterium]